MVLFNFILATLALAYSVANMNAPLAIFSTIAIIANVLFSSTKTH